jgi:hypothetical protein
MLTTVGLVLVSAAVLWSCAGAPENSLGLTEFRQRVVAAAEREWRFFGRHQRGRARRNGYREDNPRQAARIRRYWRAGVGRTVNSPRVAWSGAFISYVMRAAGAGRRFAYSGSHSPYIRRAIGAARSGDGGATFHGRRLDDYAPRPGDLVCNALVEGVDYDNLPRYWSGHCDIVVAVRRGSIDVIGGNLSDTVGKRTLLTDGRGRLREHQPRRIDPYVKRWFVVIEIRI